MLNLSNQQKNQIGATITETKLAIKPVKTDIKLKRVQLDNEMRTEQPDQAKIMGLTKKISDLQLAIRQVKVDGKSKILSALTPIQKEQLNLPFAK
jgi:Spy/CpxP family protein refolding chaperone